MTEHFRNLLLRVVESLDDTDTAFDLVLKLKDHSDDLVADLVEALDDDDAVQAAAAFSLGHMWYACWPAEIDASSSIPVLLTLIDHDNPRVGFECTRAVAVLQVERDERLTEDQIVASYLRCIERGDRCLKIEAASQLLAIEPKAGTDLAGMLDAELLLEALEDALQRPVRRVPE